MKTNLTLCAVVAAMVAPVMFFAADAPKRPYQRPEGGQRPAASAAVASRLQSGGENMRAALENLNEEQKAALRDMMETLRTNSRESTEQLTMARRALAEASFGEKPDETVIQKKAVEVGKLEGDLAVQRSKAYAEHRAKFTPEQQQAIKLMLSYPAGMGAMTARAGAATDGAGRRPGAEGLYGRPGAQEEFRKPKPPEEPKP